VTLERALSLIADKVAKGGNGAAKKPRRKSAEKSAADAKTPGKQKKTTGAGKRKRTPTGAESG
jgi:topoisomerase IA-like protein